MRRFLVISSLAVAAVVASTVYGAPAVGEHAATVAPPVARWVTFTLPSEIRDEAAMVLVGAMLIGLAAAVRRAA